MDHYVIQFYQYVPLKDPAAFREEHLAFCIGLGLKGRILVASEGINGSVAGSREQVDTYIAVMRGDVRFKDMIIKEDACHDIPFEKMVLKIKKELVRFEQEVDLSRKGKHISPREFLDLYSGDEEVVILDARNAYEGRVGKFKDAVVSPISTFREFPKVAELLKDKKDKKVVMYCTGGIRCEKASAYLIKEGFSDVSQLRGGILAFGKEFPDTVWEGKCFVFDKRIISPINTNDSSLAPCDGCGKDCDLYKNCRNNECDRFTSICIDCEKRLGGCCSEDCFEVLQKERMGHQAAST
ncbi:MAG TPA: rhodanese-related sulfurtransferase [Candidatus Nanoarchaeia archaeon]|nr:rhodanese-related sulfurtransferase [Candidatus Nanoarchaeia archaeon]